MTISSKPKRPRLEWLDMLRILCALFIAGHHWMRVCLHLHLFVNTRVPEYFRNILWGGKDSGLGWRIFNSFPTYYLLDTSGTALSYINNLLGWLFGYGWQAVNVFILVSGLSLTLSQSETSSPGSFQHWGRWYRDRLKRILLPYYLVVLTVNFTFLLLQAFLNSHATLLGPAREHVNALLAVGWPRIWRSSIFLIDPVQFDGSGQFLFSAWWFLAAIAVAYLLYPLLYSILQRRGPLPLLVPSLFISIAAYAAEQASPLKVRENTFYHIVLFELFNFCLGMYLGKLFRTPESRKRTEEFLSAPATLAVAVLLVIAGHITGNFLTLYPISSALSTPGLFILGMAAAKMLLRVPLLERLKRIDSYMFYLCHQPTAYLVGFVLVKVLHSYTTSVGFVIFLIIAVIVTALYGRVFSLFSQIMTRSRPV